MEAKMTSFYRGILFLKNQSKDSRLDLIMYVTTHLASLPGAKPSGPRTVRVVLVLVGATVL